jgi:hypothetical protein
MSTTTHADDRVEKATAIEAPTGRHLIYVELLGKAGAYGIGYEYRLMPWLSFGGAASFAVIGDQQIATAAPYVHVTMVGTAQHRMFSELGAILAHSHIPSPVPDWNGSNKSGGGGFLSVGYEHASKRVVMRASGGVATGLGGLGPMIGLSIGARP